MLNLFRRNSAHPLVATPQHGSTSAALPAASAPAIADSAIPTMKVHGETSGRAICECDVCLRGLFKYFDDVCVVNNVSFHLQKGELMALLGPSGCGKTTTLRMIAGFERLDGGEIEISQQMVAGPDLHLPPERRRIGMVFQEYALFPHLSVTQNVRFGLHHYPGDASRRIAEVLELVGLQGYAHRMPHELSGGQQQRVALARALAPKPHLILLDEPFSNLDASLRTRVRAEVRAILRAAEATAIFVTHDQEEALSLVDQVAVMMHGQVQQIAPPLKLYSMPASHDVASFVGDANFLPGTADGKSVECELGTMPTLLPHKGQVEVMIRPENLRITPAPPSTPHRVRNILFFGHDQLITVEMESGRHIDVRMVGSHYQLSAGQPVQISASGPVMTYA